MIRGNGISLAPIYDAMCCEVWQNITKNLAQKIAGESRGHRLKAKHWLQFGRECGLNPTQVLDRVGALAKGAVAEAQAAASEVAAMPAGKHVILDQTRETVEQRGKVIVAKLQDLSAEPEVEQAVHKANTGSAAKDVHSNLQ
jgi:serine/threonine-protein kinase HipA